MDGAGVSEDPRRARDLRRENRGRTRSEEGRQSSTVVSESVASGHGGSSRGGDAAAAASGVGASTVRTDASTFSVATNRTGEGSRDPSEGREGGSEREREHEEREHEEREYAARERQELDRVERARQNAQFAARERERVSHERDETDRRNQEENDRRIREHHAYERGRDEGQAGEFGRPLSFGDHVERTDASRGVHGPGYRDDGVEGLGEQLDLLELSAEDFISGSPSVIREIVDAANQDVPVMRTGTGTEAGEVREPMLGGPWVPTVQPHHSPQVFAMSFEVAPNRQTEQVTGGGATTQRSERREPIIPQEHKETAPRPEIKARTPSE